MRLCRTGPVPSREAVAPRFGREAPGSVVDGEGDGEEEEEGPMVTVMRWAPCS